MLTGAAVAAATERRSVVSRHVMAFRSAPVLRVSLAVVVVMVVAFADADPLLLRHNYFNF